MISVKKLVSFLVVISFLIGGASAGYDFERSSVFDTARDSRITFTNLQANTDYVFRDPAGNQVREFTTSSTGSAEISFDFSPIPSDFSAGKRGYNYRITSPQAENEDIYLYPGFFIRRFDHFNDGTRTGVNHGVSFEGDVYETSYSESGSELILSAGIGDNPAYVKLQILPEIYRKQSLNLEYDLSDSYSETDIRRFQFETKYGNLNIPLKDSEVSVYYNETASSLQAHYDGGYNSITGISNFTGFSGNITYTGEAGLYESGDVTIRYDYMSITPKKDRELWNFSEVFGHHPESGVINYDTVSGGTDILGDPGIQYRGYYGTGETSGWSSTLDSDFPVNGLDFRATGLGSADYFVLSVSDANILQDLSPPDEAILNDPTANFSFVWGGGDGELGGGDLRLQFLKNGTWTTIPANYEASGDCDAETEKEKLSVSVSTGLFSPSCQGDRISAVADIASYSGSTDWRFQIQDQETNNIYNSETRTFRRLLSDSIVQAVRPLNGTTLTTLKPRFIGNYDTAEPGTASLEVNGTTINQWILNSRYDASLDYTPDIPLLEGEQSYTFSFRGRSGAVSKSAEINYTINTSLADNLNISILEPKDGERRTTGNINLKYNIESTSDGTATVYLDGTPASSQGITAGNRNYSLEIRDLNPGEHSWFVVVESEDGVVYQSDTTTFDVVNDVSISPDYPKGGANIEAPPVIFNGTVNTTTQGTFSILIDGNNRETINIDEGNESFEFVIDQSLQEGKHTYSYEFTTPLGERFTTKTRTFDLELGTTEDGAVADGGLIRQIANSFIANPLGISATAAIYMVSFLISLILAIISAVFVSDREGTVFIVTMFSVLTLFAVANMFPLWVPVGIIIAGGGLLAWNFVGGG